MKVGELRNWLSELGDKNQEHYHRFHSQEPPPLPGGKTTKGTTKYRAVDDDDDDDREDLLGIQSKPSTSSTCPSTAIMEDNVFAAASFSSSEEEDYGSKQNYHDSNEFYGKDGTKTGRHSFGEVHRVTGKDHLDLLKKQAPFATQEVLPRPSSSTTSRNSDDDDDTRDDGTTFGEEEQQAGSMHNSSVFRDQVLLTQVTLDAMNRSVSSSARNHGGNSIPKSTATLGEHLRQLNEQQHQNNPAKPRLSMRNSDGVAYEGDDDDDDNTNNDDSLGLSESQESTDAPSITPGALVSKMAGVFLNNHYQQQQARDRLDLSGGQPHNASILERRKYVNPKDLSFLSSPSRSSQEAPVLSSTNNNYNNNKHHNYFHNRATTTTAVGTGIRKFGGPRKTLVERRKEQLHEKFGETRAAVFVHKKMWGQKTPNGKYQRKTVVEKIYK